MLEETVEHPNYLSYLMRLWRADREPQATQETTWRASLESAQTGATVAFANLEDLFAFLREQTGLAAEFRHETGQDEGGRDTTVVVVFYSAGHKRGKG